MGAERVEPLHELCRAHLTAAAWLAVASACLSDLAEGRDSDDSSLLARLGELRPAEEAGAVSEIETDRTFLIDRARAHREKARAMVDNGLRILAAISPEVADRDAVEGVQLGLSDEVLDGLGFYTSAIAAAGDQFEAIGAALRGAGLDGDPEWAEPVCEAGDALRFLHEEAALFAALLDQEA